MSYINQREKETFTEFKWMGANDVFTNCECFFDEAALKKRSTGATLRLGDLTQGCGAAPSKNGYLVTRG